MSRFTIDALIWILASPILFILWGVRLARRVKYWCVAYATEITCMHCRSKISLVGMWRCGCGYTYAGHLLRTCPICHSLPRMVPCLSCGASRLLPEEV